MILHLYNILHVCHVHTYVCVRSMRIVELHTYDASCMRWPYIKCATENITTTPKPDIHIQRSLWQLQAAYENYACAWVHTCIVVVFIEWQYACMLVRKLLSRVHVSRQLAKNLLKRLTVRMHARAHTYTLAHMHIHRESSRPQRQITVIYLDNTRT
jgi:hypothetical protein